MDAPVTLEVTGGVARIGLARPASGNAIDLSMARALRDRAGEVAAMPDVGAVVLFGHGDSFCVGGDLGQFAAAASPGKYLAELAGTAHQAVLALRALSVPVISAVHGACAGGGMGFALAADLVLAEPTVRFVVAYTAAGLSPDCGVSWTLTRILGPARANDLILTNRQLDGAAAERLGLVSRVIDSGTVHDAAERLARSFAEGPRAALAASARLVRHAQAIPLEQHLEAEATSIAALADSPDGREGVAAFLNKRRPEFTGASQGS